MKRLVIPSIIIIFLLFILIPVFLINEKRELPEKVEIVIERGRACSYVLNELREKNLIKHRLILHFLLKISGKSKGIKAGEYEFEGRISDIDVLKKILKGEVKKYPLTIPEGSNIYQIAKMVYRVCPSDNFLSLAMSPDIARRYGINSSSLEGFLFPDTYFFEKSDNCERVIDTMVKRFFKEWSPEFRERAEEMGMSMEEVITLASIIEKEAKVKEEAPLISAVFHNRLKKNMFLQADPTVIYGLLPEFDGNLKKEHLKTPGPYNTYRRKGLPPTPICNPGKNAIYSALYPAQVPYLYFVSKNDGTHVFTTSLKEHNYYVEIYQKRGERRSGNKEGRNRK